jgi:hypothetical protein
LTWLVAQQDDVVLMLVEPPTDSPEAMAPALPVIEPRFELAVEESVLGKTAGYLHESGGAGIKVSCGRRDDDGLKCGPAQCCSDLSQRAGLPACRTSLDLPQRTSVCRRCAQLRDRFPSDLLHFREY